MERNIISEVTKNKIRERREKECFSICDRAAWYDSLSASRKREVQEWRKLWLDATETGICPKAPAWIK